MPHIIAHEKSFKHPVFRNKKLPENTNVADKRKSDTIPKSYDAIKNAAGGAEQVQMPKKK